MIRKRSGGFDIRQMQIDWNGVKPAPPVDSSSQWKDAAEQGGAASAVPGNRPVLRLRWDFRTSFPPLLPEAIEAGRISAEFATPEHIRDIHERHGHNMLGALSRLDNAIEQWRHNYNAASCSDSNNISELSRIERWYENLLGLYEEWFGAKAAKAFDHAVRAWHSHVEVVVERKPPAEAVATPGTRVLEAPSVVIAQGVGSSAVARPHFPERTPGRVIARLPVLKPLPIAISEQHFGVDDEGNSVRPSATEFREITQTHAEKLIALLEDSKRRTPQDDLLGQYHEGITVYERSFGERAARQLEAYVHRHAHGTAGQQRQRGTTDRGRGR